MVEKKQAVLFDMLLRINPTKVWKSIRTNEFEFVAQVAAGPNEVARSRAGTVL